MKFFACVSLLFLSTTMFADDRTFEDMLKFLAGSGDCRSANREYNISTPESPRRFSLTNTSLVGYARGVRIDPEQGSVKVRQILDPEENVLFENIEVFKDHGA